MSDELKRAEQGERSGDVTSQTICARCKGPMLFQGSTKNWQCPNCVKPEPHGKITVIFKDGSRRVVTEEEARELEGKPPLNPVATKLPQSLIDASLKKIGFSADLEEIFDHLDTRLQEAKFDSVNQAKKILNLRKKLNNLKFEIKTFLEGGK